MNSTIKMAIAVLLMMGVGTFVILLQGGSPFCCPGLSGGHIHQTWDDEGEPEEPIPALAPAELPRLVELGSTSCVPCQMMKPIMEDISADYEGKLEVVFVDVQQDLATAHHFNIETIPTQVFVAPSGHELYRNEGLLSKEDILNKWSELGFEFN